MKKLLLIPALLILLLVGFSACNLLSYFEPERKLIIKDSSSVSRIEILANDTIQIERVNQSWKLIDKSDINKLAVDNLLFCFQRLSIKSSYRQTPDFREKAIRLKIFTGKKVKVFNFYNINSVPILQTEGSEVLYAVEVRGFPKINLIDVISANPDDWRDRTLLNLKPEEIRSVSVIHPEAVEKEFTLEINEGVAVLTDSEGKKIPEEQINTEKINFYLSYFTNVFYDSTLNIAVPAQQLPRWIIRTTDTSGNKTELQVYPVENDMFKARVKFNDEPRLKETRYMVLDLLLQDKAHFLK